MLSSVAISFTNFGPYHLARLRALAERLGRSGCRLIAYETAGTQGLYPVEDPPRAASRSTGSRSSPTACSKTSRGRTAPGRCGERSTATGPTPRSPCGYCAARVVGDARWARATERPSVLMSESQAIDHPRVWWKEAVKRRRVRRFSSALVGGPRHRDYLVSLGMPAGRIALGYNAVDGNALRRRGRGAAARPGGPRGLPESRTSSPSAGSRPRKTSSGWSRRMPDTADGPERRRPGTWSSAATAPRRRRSETAVAASGFAGSIHRPGFLQAGELSRWYAFASAFVHPSLMEPWGLVVNEAAACGLPLLVSDRAGCVETFVPEGAGDDRPAARRRARRADGRCPGVGRRPFRRERRALGGRAAEIAARLGAGAVRDGGASRRSRRPSSPSGCGTGDARSRWRASEPGQGRPARGERDGHGHDDGTAVSRPGGRRGSGRAGSTSATGSTRSATAGWCRASWG